MEAQKTLNSQSSLEKKERRQKVKEVVERVAMSHRAGHFLVKNDTTKAVSPLGVNEGAYVALPSGHSYLGVLKASIAVKDARAAILTMGQVNAAASPYPVTDAIKKGLPNIQFLY